MLASFALLSVSFFCFFLAVKPGVAHGLETLRARMSQKARLLHVSQRLQDWIETLESGSALEPTHWAQLKTLSEPWATLTSRSLSELRQRGASLLPTLYRLKKLAELEYKACLESQSHSAQALLQAWVSAVLVPVLSLSLYFLLPALSSYSLLWLLITLLALGFSVMAGLWMKKLSDCAVRGGLEASRAGSLLFAFCTGERFLALLKSGETPDTAWVESCRFLKEGCAELSNLWGAEFWSVPEPNSRESRFRSGSPIFGLLVGFGDSLKKAVQASVFEGKPCTERVESALDGLRLEVTSRIETEIRLLGTRCLKPLFVFIAPALLLILVSGIGLTVMDVNF